MHTAKLIMPITLFLTPLLFLAFTPNIFTPAKELLVIVSILLLLLSWGSNVVMTRSLTTSSSILRFGLLAFALVLGLNVAMNPEGRVESLVGPVSLYLALTIWSYSLTMNGQVSLRRNILWSIAGSMFVLALHTLLQLTVLYRVTFLPTFMHTREFSLTGNPLATFILLAIGAVLMVRLMWETNHPRVRLLLTVGSILQIITLVALGFLLLPGRELALTLFPYSASWNLALDTLKSLRTMMTGVGLANFTLFYKSAKPLFLNNTMFWNTAPASASSEILQIMTTMGLVGLASFIALPVLSLKQSLKDMTEETRTYRLLLALSFIALLLTPGSIPTLLLFFTALGALGSAPVHTHSLKLPVSVVIAVLVLAFVGLTGWYGYRAYAAEVHMRNAQNALAQNDGKKVYEENLAAIKLMPLMTSYHLSYSQVNLSLAGALSQKSGLSDNDRQNVATLISQAIRDGKLATSLRPHDAVTWQNLGTLYRNLVNVASGADQFAVTAYTQAVALDPGNPALRLEFGGLLFQIGQTSKKAEDQSLLYSKAQNEFQTAIQLKPDYANAYYNLAKLLETTKDYSNSYLAMQKALSLLGPTSTDLSRVTSELDALKGKLPKPSPSPSPAPAGKNEGTLTTPSPLPSPLPGGPITIPESN